MPRRDWTNALLEHARGVHTDVAWHLLVAEQKNTVIGIASGTFLGNINVGVVGYLAIAPSAQARGLGARLRRALRRRFVRDAKRITGRQLDGIIGEISLDNPWLRALSRNPAVLPLNFEYYQPRLREDDKPSRFVLYYEAVGRPVKQLGVAELRRILFAMWRRAYRIARPLDRPAFRRMLSSLTNKRTVGRLRLPSIPPRPTTR